MSKYYKISVDNVWLTDTGSEDGLACKLSVAGADALLTPYSGSVIPAVDGTPIMQIFETGTKGKVLEIRVLVLTQTVWESLITIINSALGSGDTINLTGAGDVGDFDVDCLPLLPKPFEAQEFKNNRIKNPIFRFITT